MSDSISLRVVSADRDEVRRIAVRDGYVTLRPGGEPVLWPADLLDGATMRIGSAISEEQGVRVCVPPLTKKGKK